jgi:hypothetical protein
MFYWDGQHRPLEKVIVSGAHPSAPEGRVEAFYLS